MWWLAFLALAGSFNIDTKSPIVHSRSSSKFGYALDFFYEQKGLPVLMIGAPQAESQNPQLRGIRRAGAVYACSTTQANTCKEVFADSDEGNERRLNGSRMVPIEDKSDQFFGATVSASNNHKKIMMCAPQYKYFFTKFEVIEPVGACFYLETGAKKAFELSSCRQDNQKHGRHRLGYGQCGFSAAVSDEGERSFLGSPGMFYWQGGVFSQANTNYSDRLNTSYSPKEYDHNMMGYAVGTGDFNGDGEEDAVAGAPRGDDLMGKLVLYTKMLKHIVNLTDTSSSPQTGQYCGHSIAVTDLNDDGKDDIVTGCPFFTDYVTKVDAKTQERKPQYEVGKLLVFLQTAPGVFSKPLVIIGEEEWGRFGFSVAAVGDLNKDGYNDIVVGAPRGGKDKKGAVFVIHGGKDGVRVKPTQKIEAASLSSSPKGLGFSVAGGVDVDGNGIPDVAIGAVQSGSAYVLLSKPVVTVTGSTSLDRSTVSLDETNCEVDKKIGRQACRVIKTCLKYEGKGETPNELDFTLTYNLDDLAVVPRAHFLSRLIKEDRTLKASSTSKTKDHPTVVERRIRLEKAREKCFSMDFFVSSTMRDRLSPIHYSVNYTYEGSTTGRLRGGKLEPAIDTTVPLAFEGKLSIANNCGKDELCVPNLKVSASTDRPKLVLGTKDDGLVLNVDVDNAGEDAYESKLYLKFPQGLEFGGLQTEDGKTAPACSPSSKASEDGEWEWECDLGNPLPATKNSRVSVRLGVDEKNPPTKEVTVVATVNSTNPEAEGSALDNTFTLTLPVDYDNNLDLIGQTDPQQVDFSTTNKSNLEKFDDSDFGPLVSHMFQVSNKGPSRMDVSLDIFWPSFSTEGNHLFYLITEPTLSDPSKGHCRVKQMGNVNPLNLRLTGEHLPTAPPAPKVPAADYEETGDDRSYEDIEEDEHTQHTTHVEHETVLPSSSSNNFEWTEKEKPKVEYEYIPDEQYTDDGEYDEERREKRQVKRRKGEGRRREGQQNAQPTSPQNAKFSQLRDAVALSKAAQGAVEYTGNIGRASVDCNALRCTHIECDLHDIEKGDFVLVQVFSRVSTDTLVDERNPGGDVSSLAVARVVNQPNRPNKQTLLTAVTTHLNAVSTDPSSGGVPWWLYLLAILIGLLILALLILLLWRCGFFKRDRPPSAHAEKVSSEGPDARYADTKTRYGAGQDERAAML